MATPVAIFVIGVALLLSATLTEQFINVTFGYSGNIGPDKWGSLSPQYSTCSTGKLQSPINIVKKDLIANQKLQPLTRDYADQVNATLVNNGFNIGIRFARGAGALSIDGKEYNLKQMHWHSPSEHTLDGVRYDGELHLVHATDDQNVSVVAILYQFGDADPLVDKLKNQLEELKKDKCGGDEEAHIPVGLMETKQMERKTVKYVRYIGSFTTPPCTENVIWNILGKVRTISKEQVEALKAPLDSAYKQNSRPTQPLNGRKVELYDEQGGK